MYDRIHPYPFVLFIWKITVLHVFIADFTYQSIHIVLSLPHLLLLFYTNTPILTQLQAFLTIPDRPCPFIPPHLNVIPYHKSLRVMSTTSNLRVLPAPPSWGKYVWWGVRSFFRTRVRETFPLSHFLSFNLSQDWIRLYLVKIPWFTMSVLIHKETLH